MKGKKRGSRKRKSSYFSGLKKKDFSNIYPLTVRLLIFFSIVFLAIPLFINFLGVKASIAANYVYVLLFVALVIGLFVYFNWKELVKYSFKCDWMETLLFAGVATVFFILHYASKYLVAGNIASIMPATYFLFSGFLYVMLVAFVAFSVFGYSFIAYFYRSLTIMLSIVLPYVSITLLIRSYWHVFSTTLIKTNVWLIKKAFYMVPDLAIAYTLNGDPSFTLEGFDVVIGAPCSGIDSLVLFAGFFILITLLDWKKFDSKRVFIMFPIGLLGMFGMSVLRIFTLMVVGAFYNPALALNLFHTNLGWTIFIAYFFVFLWFAYPWMKKKEFKKKRR